MVSPSSLSRCAIATLVLALARAGAAAEPNTPPTSAAFAGTRAVDGRRYTLIGEGTRQRLGVKVYAMALYVEDAEARRAFPSMAMKAGGSDRAHLLSGDRAQAFVLWGQFGKRAVLRFLEDTPAADLRAELEPGLTGADQGGARALLALVDRDLKAGETLELSTNTAGQLDLVLAGQPRPPLKNVRLARAVWNAWLGPKAVAKELRTDLVGRIDALGR